MKRKEKTEMHTEKFDGIESGIWVQARFNRSAFVRDMMNRVPFPELVETENLRYLTLEGNRGMIIFPLVADDGEFYIRKKKDGSLCRGSKTFLAAGGITARIYDAQELIDVALSKPFFVQVERVSDRRIFEMALLMPFPDSQAKNHYSCGVYNDSGRLGVLTVEPRRTPKNQPAAQFIKIADLAKQPLAGELSTLLGFN